MRQWIALVENLDADIRQGYDAFLTIWLDHYRTWDEDMATPEPTFEEYIGYAYDIAEKLRQSPLYRGIQVSNLEFLDSGILGIHWSEDLHTARGFSYAGSIYDERFTDVRVGNIHTLRVIIEIEPVDPEFVDMPATTAFNIAGGEQEIRLRMGSPVTLKALWVDGKAMEHAAIGRMFHA